MKNKYSDLMYCGYCISSSNGFFNELALVHQYVESHPSSEVRKVILDFYNLLKNRTEEVTHFLNFPAPKLAALGVQIPAAPKAPTPKAYFTWLNQVEEAVSVAIPNVMGLEFIAYSFGKYVAMSSSCLDMVRHASNICADTEKLLDLTGDIATILTQLEEHANALSSLVFFLKEASNSDSFSTVTDGIFAVLVVFKQYNLSSCNETELKNISNIAVSFFEMTQQSFGECLRATGTIPVLP